MSDHDETAKIDVQASHRPVMNAEEPRRYELSADVVMLGSARHAEAEAIRTMRSHLMARHIDGGKRGLAMCAVTRGVGCTFSAVNLAVSLAQIGVDTLLIDGDLNAPGVDAFIRPLQPNGGLQQCLAPSGPDPDDLIHNQVVPNLSVLYAGPPSSQNMELLGGEPFKRLIERALRDYQFTIVDTPPTSTSVDASRISKLVGYSVIVAKRNLSFINDITTLATELREDGGEVIGTVLNEVG